eukprot:TRINITY_DN1567_c2_g1_i1.p1 TRINITY_DN1567_c2_g1~~TRINITY_DN1567_c2_g1_i1.p1  ORF type:complete len:385 (+),score=87.72 TRINITY_DN1567_c2_g1_i1:82-1236(+)
MATPFNSPMRSRSLLSADYDAVSAQNRSTSPMRGGVAKARRSRGAGGSGVFVTFDQPAYERQVQALRRQVTHTEERAAISEGRSRELLVQALHERDAVGNELESVLGTLRELRIARDTERDHLLGRCRHLEEERDRLRADHQMLRDDHRRACEAVRAYDKHSVELGTHVTNLCSELEKQARVLAVVEAERDELRKSLGRASLERDAERRDNEALARRTAALSIERSQLEDLKDRAERGLENARARMQRVEQFERVMLSSGAAKPPPPPPPPPTGTGGASGGGAASPPRKSSLRSRSPRSVRANGESASSPHTSPQRSRARARSPAEDESDAVRKIIDSSKELGFAYDCAAPAAVDGRDRCAWASPSLNRSSMLSRYYLPRRPKR